MKTVGQQHKILFGVLFGVLAMNASVMNTAIISNNDGVAHLASNEIARMSGGEPQSVSALRDSRFDYIRTRGGQSSGSANDESYRQQVRCESGDRGFRIPDHIMDIDFEAAEDDESYDDEDEDRPGRRRSTRAPSDNPTLTPAQLAEVAAAQQFRQNRPEDCTGATPAQSTARERIVRINDREFKYYIVVEAGLSCLTAAPTTASASQSLFETPSTAGQTTVRTPGQIRVSVRFGSPTGNSVFGRLIDPATPMTTAGLEQINTSIFSPLEVAIRDREIIEGNILEDERKVRTCEYRWPNPDNHQVRAVRVREGSTYERQCRMARLQSRGGREAVNEFQDEIAELQLAARNGDTEAMEELHDLGCSDSLPRNLKNIAMASYLTGEVMTDLRSTFTENCRRQGQEMNCDRNIMLAAGAIGNEASSVFGTLGARRNADVREIADYAMVRATGVQDSWQSSAIALAVSESIATNRAPGAGLRQYDGNNDNRNVIDNSLGLRMTRAQGSVSPDGLPNLSLQGLNPATVRPTRGEGSIVRL